MNNKPVNYKIVYLSEVVFSESDLEKIGDEFESLLVTLCYSINEIHFFQKQFMSLSILIPYDKVIEKKRAIDKMIVTRHMNAKILETVDGLDGFSINFARRDDLDIEQKRKTKQLIKKHLGPVVALKKEIGYQISLRIRNDATYHVRPDTIRGLRKKFPGGAELSLYLHQSTGDTFFPIGERYFSACLSNAAASSGLSDAETIDLWMEWSLSAAMRINRSFQDFMVELTGTVLTGTVALERAHWVEPGLVQSEDGAPLPLFFTERL